MSASGKRCHYEVLGVSRDASPEEIRSSYKRLALKLHPDKLVQSGLSQAEATSKFQELSLAYEVLSNTQDRASYDSNRSQILFSDPDSAGDSYVPDLFSFFSPSVYSGYGDSEKGFYKVYSDVFARVYANEVGFVRTLGLGFEKLREAPVMGNLESPYEQVIAFYNYWLGFATVMDFSWVDMYDAEMGENRKSRRVMRDENEKLRKKARREYNVRVRELAAFVKKRDKRVIDMIVRKAEEEEKRKEEARERKRRFEREKMERAEAYVEPEWSRVKAEEPVDAVEEEEESEKKELLLYCVVCSKKFTCEKQWKNHEQSNKHKDKVAELRHVDFHEHKDGGVDHDVDELGERLEGEEDMMQYENRKGRGRRRSKKKNRKSWKTSIPKKEVVKKEANNKSKSSSKGKKGKGREFLDLISVWFIVCKVFLYQIVSLVKRPGYKYQ